MPLNPDQKELLSAYLDHEAEPAEIALAMALLERPEAQAYLNDLRRVAGHVRDHGGAGAPADFRQRVMANLDGDFDSISRPTSNQLPVEFAPQASWRMPLMAAAAAVIVAVGVLFSGVLSYDAPPQTETAASAGKQTPAPVLPPSHQPVGAPSEDPAAHTDDAKEHGKPHPGKGGNDKPQPQPKDKGGAKTGGTTDGKGGPRGGDSVKEDAEDALARPQLSFDDAATEISVQFNRRASVTSVYTEILSTSSLYGTASLRTSRVNYATASAGADFTQYHGVEVEIDEERIPELLAALERLTHEQGMGAVVVPGHLRRAVAGNLRYLDALMDVAEALAKGETPDARELERTRSPADLQDTPALESYRKPARADDGQWRRAGGILPAQAQREIVENLERARNSEARRDAAQASSSRPVRSVHVLIRLQ
jgi:negative regulator of sigma E activity